MKIILKLRQTKSATESSTAMTEKRSFDNYSESDGGDLLQGTTKSELHLNIGILEHLPREIRDEIYQLILVSDKPLVNKTGIYPYDTVYRHSRLKYFDTSLLQVNKLIYNETSHVLLRENTLIFDAFRYKSMAMIPLFKKVGNRILREGRRIQVALDIVNKLPEEILHNCVDGIAKGLVLRDNLKELTVTMVLKARSLMTNVDFTLVHSLIQKVSILKSISSCSIRATSHYLRLGEPGSPLRYYGSSIKVESVTKDFPVIPDISISDLRHMLFSSDRGR